MSRDPLRGLWEDEPPGFMVQGSQFTVREEASDYPIRFAMNHER